MKLNYCCPIAILAASLLYGVRAQAQDPFTNGLVAFYPLIGNADDATGNGNNGTVNGVSLTTGHYGTPNSAYSFPGVSGKNITINSTNLMMQAPFSFSLWLNLSGGTESPRIVCVDANWQGYALVAGAGSPRKLVFETDYGSGGYGAWSSNVFVDGVWHQAVCVRTTNSLFIYVDGQLQGSAQAVAPVVFPPDFGTAWLPTLGGQATIGYPYDNYGGSIDSVRFYNRALSSQEVIDLYAYETRPGVSFGLSPRLTISGLIGKNYIIQRTANLEDTNSWITVGNLTLTAPVQIWVDTNIDSTLPGNPHYYYKLRP